MTARALSVGTFDRAGTAKFSGSKEAAQSPPRDASLLVGAVGSLALHGVVVVAVVAIGLILHDLNKNSPAQLSRTVAVTLVPLVSQTETPVVHRPQKVAKPYAPATPKTATTATQKIKHTPPSTLPKPAPLPQYFQKPPAPKPLIEHALTLPIPTPIPPPVVSFRFHRHHNVPADHTAPMVARQNVHPARPSSPPRQTEQVSSPPSQHPISLTPSPSAPPLRQSPSQSPRAGKAETRRLSSELASWLDAHRQYPELARIRGWQGHVIVRLIIDAGGRPRVTIARSSGVAILDQAAIALIRQAVAAIPAVTGPVGPLRIPIDYALKE